MKKTEPIPNQKQDFQPEEIGFYTNTTNKGKTQTLASSLFSLQETKQQTADKENAKIMPKIASGYPLSFWLLLLGTLVLVAESFLYHRRKAE